MQLSSASRNRTIKSVTDATATFFFSHWFQFFHLTIPTPFPSYACSQSQDHDITSDEGDYDGVDPEMAEKFEEIKMSYFSVCYTLFFFFFSFYFPFLSVGALTDQGMEAWNIILLHFNIWAQFS